MKGRYNLSSQNLVIHNFLISKIVFPSVVYYLICLIPVQNKEILNTPDKCKTETIYTLDQENFFYFRFLDEENSESNLPETMRIIGSDGFELLRTNIDSEHINYNLRGEISEHISFHAINRYEYVIIDARGYMFGAKIIFTYHDKLKSCFELVSKSSEKDLEERMKPFFHLASEHLNMIITEYIYGESFIHSMKFLTERNESELVNISCFQEGNKGNVHQMHVAGTFTYDYTIKIDKVSTTASYSVECKVTVKDTERLSVKYQLPIIKNFITNTTFKLPKVIKFNDKVARLVNKESVEIGVSVSVFKIGSVFTDLEGQPSFEISGEEAKDISRFGITYILESNRLLINTSRFCIQEVKFKFKFTNDEEEVKSIKLICAFDESTFLREYLPFHEDFGLHRFEIKIYRVDFLHAFEVILNPNSENPENILCTFLNKNCSLSTSLKCEFVQSKSFICQIYENVFLKQNYEVSIFMFYSPESKSDFFFTHRSHEHHEYMWISEESPKMKSLLDDKRIVKWVFLPPFFKVSIMEIYGFAKGASQNQTLIASITAPNTFYSDANHNLIMNKTHLIFHSKSIFASKLILKFVLKVEKQQSVYETITAKYLETFPPDIEKRIKLSTGVILGNYLIMPNYANLFIKNDLISSEFSFQVFDSQENIPIIYSYHDIIRNSIYHQYNALLFNSTKEYCGRKVLLIKKYYHATKIVNHITILRVLCSSGLMDSLYTEKEILPDKNSKIHEFAQKLISFLMNQSPIESFKIIQQKSFGAICHEDHPNVPENMHYPDQFETRICLLC